MPEVTPDSAQTAALLDEIQHGDRQALDRLLAATARIKASSRSISIRS